MAGMAAWHVYPRLLSIELSLQWVVVVVVVVW